MKQYKLSKIVLVYTEVSGNKTKLKGNAVASFSFLYSDMRISSLKRDTWKTSSGRKNFYRIRS